MRVVLLLLAAAIALYGETFKLYLKDGTYQVTREYQVQGDRIRYFSTERGEWEEIPKDLIDLVKTESERKAKNDILVKEAREQDEEEKAVARSSERNRRDSNESPARTISRTRQSRRCLRPTTRL